VSTKTVIMWNGNNYAPAGGFDWGPPISACPGGGRPAFPANISINEIAAHYSPIKEDFPIKESFKAGEKIILKISLSDNQNIPLNAEVKLTFQNADKTKSIEKNVQSNKIIEVDLENASSGFWNIIAKYNTQEVKSTFSIEEDEKARFSLEGDNLIVENIGNTKYEETLDIVIGDTIGKKIVSLNIGEKSKFRLIAPDGTYSIKVSDGKTTLNKGEVKLTGEAIGILDERMTTRALITNVGGEDSGNGEPYNPIKGNKFIYFFVAAVIGALVLLAIERSYKRKLGEQ